DQADRFDNRIDVMTKTFLGLTVACARCHDHKFDAISTRDYYALFSFLESSSYRLARFDSMEHNRRVARELWALRERSRPALQRAVAGVLRPTAARAADYLLAAREVYLGRGGRERLEEVARERGLNAVLLAGWAAHLAAAARDDGDLLHAWAAEPGALAEAWRKRRAEAAAALKGFEVVVDYAALRPGEWLPDGVAFGPGPVRPGEVRLGSD